MPRAIAGIVAALAALLLLGSAGWAADYPSRPIRVIVPYGAGQATDIMCRAFLDELKIVLKQPLVVENRVGAATNIGAAVAAKATPDGYTLLCTGNATAVANPLLYSSMGFDPDTDLMPISGIAATGYIMAVNNSLKGKTLQDVVAQAKTAAHRLLVGQASTTATVIYGMVREAAKVPLERVPYTSGNMSLFPDLMRGQTDLVIEAMPSAIAAVSNGQVTPIAVSMPERSTLLPDVPTFKEGGLDVVLVGWNAFYAPKGTPQEIIATLNRASVEALSHPEVAKRLATVACVPMPTTPEGLTKLTKDDRAKWEPMVKLLDLKAN
jgi:tripartite-type tricarboxylate transporter receptor subunit TctC